MAPITFNPFDLSNYYEEKHAACFHSVDKAALGSVRYNGGYTAIFEMPQKDPTGPILYVHPRWCPDCLRARTDALTRLLHRRLARINENVIAFDTERMLSAYVQGVFQGRIAALNMPLEVNKECGDTGVEDDGSVDELVDMLLGAHLDKKNGIVDELAKILAKANLTDIECTLEELNNIERAETEQGVKDGRGLQSKMEAAAMREVDPKTRETWLQRALL